MGGERRKRETFRLFLEKLGLIKRVEEHFRSSWWLWINKKTFYFCENIQIKVGRVAIKSFHSSIQSVTFRAEYLCERDYIIKAVMTAYITKYSSKEFGNEMKIIRLNDKILFFGRKTANEESPWSRILITSWEWENSAARRVGTIFPGFSEKFSPSQSILIQLAQFFHFEKLFSPAFLVNSALPLLAEFWRISLASTQIESIEFFLLLWSTQLVLLFLSKKGKQLGARIKTSEVKVQFKQKLDNSLE